MQQQVETVGSVSYLDYEIRETGHSVRLFVHISTTLSLRTLEGMAKPMGRVTVTTSTISAKWAIIRLVSGLVMIVIGIGLDSIVNAE